MFIKRDPEFEVLEDFKLRVRTKLEPTSSVDVISLNGKVYGWALGDQSPVKILVVSKEQPDMHTCLIKLHSLLGSGVDAHTYAMGEETVSILDTLELGKHKILFVPNPSDFTLDDLLVLFIQARTLGVKLVYSEGENLYELTGLSPQATKIA